MQGCVCDLLAGAEPGSRALAEMECRAIERGAPGSDACSIRSRANRRPTIPTPRESRVPFGNEVHLIARIDEEVTEFADLFLESSAAPNCRICRGFWLIGGHPLRSRGTRSDRFKDNGLQRSQDASVRSTRSQAAGQSSPQPRPPRAGRPGRSLGRRAPDPQATARPRPAAELCVALQGNRNRVPQRPWWPGHR